MAINLRTVLQSLVSSLVLSQLDYSKTTLSRSPQYLIKQLQSVMNSAARLVFAALRFDHVTPPLRQLHWLQTRKRIEFKLAILVYRTAPPYLCRRAASVSRLKRLWTSSLLCLVDISDCPPYTSVNSR